MSLELGIPVGELQQRVSSQEFTEYLAFFSIEPWSAVREDINNAAIVTMLANAHRDTKAKPQPFNLNDFRTDYWKKIEAPIQQTNLRMKQEMELLGKIMGTKKVQGTMNG